VASSCVQDCNRNRDSLPEKLFLSLRTTCKLSLRQKLMYLSIELDVSKIAWWRRCFWIEAPFLSRDAIRRRRRRHWAAVAMCRLRSHYL
jgi:hypothetical protein